MATTKDITAAENGRRLEASERPNKLALLIGCPLNLTGPRNDIDAMYKMLESRGFDSTQLCGEAATREGILKSWDHLIDSIQSPQDSVVIYYSGHGGFMKSTPESTDIPAEQPQKHYSYTPHQYQFLIPMDYCSSTSDDFRGILDIEISHKVRDTTQATKNVTIILDCCYAGRMARNPEHDDFRPKCLPDVQYKDLSNHVARLRESQQLHGLTYVEANPHAVRIVAATDSETAGERLNDEKVQMGIFTDAFIKDVNNHGEVGWTWRSVLHRVAEMIRAKRQNQEAHVEGPHNRIMFSIEEKGSKSVIIEQKDGVTVIHSGRFDGVNTEDRFTVMPSHFQEVDEHEALAEAVVTEVLGFRSVVKLDPGMVRISSGTALAFPKAGRPKQWPAIFPDDIRQFKEAIAESKFLRPLENYDPHECLVSFTRKNDQINAYNSVGIRIASRQISSYIKMEDAVRELVEAGNMLGRAQNILSLGGGKGQEALNHGLEVCVDWASNNKSAFNEENIVVVTENESVVVTLKNNGHDTVYVSVFDIDVTGEVYLISVGSPLGIKLEPGSTQKVAMEQEQTEMASGSRVCWTKGIPKEGKICETLMCVVSSGQVDLRDLSEPRPSDSRNRKSQLEKLVEWLASGNFRIFGGKPDPNAIRYDVLQYKFLIQPDPE